MTKIPKIIHQIWIGPDKIPNHCLEFIKEMKEINPDFKHFLWGNEVFSRVYKDDPFLQNYIKQPEVYKWAHIADRIRLLLLRDFGGVYVDVDAKPIKSFDSSIFLKLNKNISFFAGYRNINPPWNDKLIDCMILGSSKNSRIINSLLEMYVDVNWAWAFKPMSSKIFEISGPDVCIFHHNKFFNNLVTKESILYHENNETRLKSWY